MAPEIAQADLLDASGRHMEAINCLVAAVRRHDIEALTRLGKRLLIDDRAPELQSDGARMLAEASNRGGAEAAALYSVLLAVGLTGQPNLGAARASHVNAAQRGWTDARTQLEILADAPAAGESAATNSSRDHWQ